MNSAININFEECKLARKDIYPVSIHCCSACNLVVWRSESDPGEQWDEVKRYLARLMDRLADLLHDYQQFAPLVALIDIRVESSSWSQVMGDQDWHRGRFVLQGVKPYGRKSVEEAKSRWLGAMQVDEYIPRRITVEDFSASLTDAVKVAKPPKGVEPQLFSRYADILKSSIDAGGASSVADQWQNELMRDINNLLGRAVLEGSTIV